MYFTLLGSRIACLASYEHTCNKLISHIESKQSVGYVTVNNAHTLVEGILHPEYRTIINNSFLSLADGGSLALVGRLKGAKDMRRIFGPSLMEYVLEHGQSDSLRHFFFGSTPEILEEMAVIIRQRFPRVVIAGVLSPPFRPFTEEENKEFLRQIRDSRADIIWVSLGAPKQERWICEVYKELDHGIFIGIGAGFSYLTGRIKHAPQWMKRYALEWVYRLIQEPRRLYKRYLVANTLFILFLFLESIGMLPLSKDSHS